MKSSTFSRIKPGGIAGALAALLTVAAFSAAAADKILDDPEFKKAVAAYAENRLDESKRGFEQLARRFPNNPSILNNLAVIAVKQNDIERAMKLLRRAIATDAAIDAGYRNLSAIYARLASQSYRDALSLESVDPQPLELSLVGEDERPPDAPDAEPDVAAQVAQAKEVNEPMVRDPAAPALSAQNRDVVSAIKRWAGAWSSRNIDAYFASYADGYSPPDLAHRDWKRQRTERVTAPQHIEVNLSEIRVRMNGENDTQATFRQRYRSNLMKSSVIKQLRMKRINNEWKIVAERVI